MTDSSSTAPATAITKVADAPEPSRARKARIDYSSNSPDEILASNRIVASPFQVSKHKKDAARNWDIFYKNNKDGFFKDRHWTDREFKVLSALDTPEEGEGKGKGKIVLEVGCGTGAFVYPLLERYPSARFHAFDFSKRAVELVKNHPKHTTARVHAFVHDLTCPPESPSLPQQLASAPSEFWELSPPSISSPASSSSSPEAVEGAPVHALPQRPDIISCVFVLSALPPSKQAAAVQSLVQVLAPGGSILLRDYALHDQAQLRFHALPSKGYASIPSLLSGPLPSADAPPSPSSTIPTPTDADPDASLELGKPWYRRGDGTMTYFFTPEEVDGLVQAGCEEGWRMEGECSLVEMEMANRAEGWGCTRRFVQGSWKKVKV